ncbi:hypothetical protein Ahy_B01g053992 isoform B [Arachis hypogaea]|uniref:Uncharacterized protein n=1 Tax=Arachis hypogaea TaxID=3818 RepID=A0A445AT34_ARAHY|nr:hypothetical protein Ahy_B01g053992 isoform B [Arachis hypogaea]
MWKYIFGNNGGTIDIKLKGGDWKMLKHERGIPPPECNSKTLLMPYMIHSLMFELVFSNYDIDDYIINQFELI